MVGVEHRHRDAELVVAGEPGLPADVGELAAVVLEQEVLAEAREVEVRVAVVVQVAGGAAHAVGVDPEPAGGGGVLEAIGPPWLR